MLWDTAGIGVNRAVGSDLCFSSVFFVLGLPIRKRFICFWTAANLIIIKDNDDCS